MKTTRTVIPSTRRLASLAAGLVAATFVLCGHPAQALPTIGTVSPDGAYQFQGVAPSSDVLKFAVTSSVGVTAVSVTLTGTNLPGAVAVTNLTVANGGLTVSGADTDETITAPLAKDTTYGLLITATDSSGAASYVEVFDTISPGYYTFEAEDFDYNGGYFFDNPQVEDYDNLTGTPGIDCYHPSDSGDDSYRPNPLETEVAGDRPRAQFSGNTDYDVGYNYAGDWGNYTRTYRAGLYNIYCRISGGNSVMANACTMDLVTSGSATTHNGGASATQTTNYFGSFTTLNLGWQTYTFAPCIDTNGQLVAWGAAGDIETLRVTVADANENQGFFMLVPAAPSVTPNVTTLFQGGSPVTLSIDGKALHTPGYQWQTDNGSGGVTWSALSGATDSSYTVNPSILAAKPYQYRVVLTNISATIGYTTVTATSSPVTLTVIGPTPPSVVQNPTSVTAVIGSVTSFAASFQGLPPITNQWQISWNGGNAFTNLPNQTNSVLLTTNLALVTNVYVCVASNSFGSGSSASATLTVIPTRPLDVAGDLIVDLVPTDLANATTTWTNRSISPNSVGDFQPPIGNSLTTTNVSWGGALFTALSALDNPAQALFSARLTPAEINGNGTVSMEAWIYALSVPSQQCVLNYGVDGGSTSTTEAEARDFGYGVAGYAGFTGYYGDSDAGWSDPTVGWHYVAVTYDQTTLRLYQDGVADNTAGNPLQTVQSTMMVGQSSGGPSDAGGANLFDGYIAAARVMSGVLTPAQISNNFAAGPLGLAPVLLSAPSLTPRQTTIYQGASVTLGLVDSQESLPFTYQWQTDGGSGGVTWSNLPGATATNYALNTANLEAKSYQFDIVLSNSAYALSITSAPVSLTALSITGPPAVQQVYNIGPTNVVIVFAAPVTSASADKTANYVFTNGLDIASASLASDNMTLTLGTAALTYYSNYSIVLNGILSGAPAPVIIPTNTLVSFAAKTYTSVNIGSSPIPSTENAVSGGVIVTAAGVGIGGSDDQFNYQYQTLSGNFDVSVCLANLGLSSVWAQAGLMARSSSNADSPFAATLATPGMNGDSFDYRQTTAGTAASLGSFPVDYPDTWLRLNRVGSVFTGFGSYDGTNWTELGTASIVMTDPIYLGLVVDSYQTNQNTSAQFISFGATPAGGVAAAQPNPSEPLGPSSRKTQIAFSEINYKPAPRADSNDLEFVELYNSQPWFHDISHYQIVCADMNYTFPAGTIIPGGGFLVVAASPSDIENVYGITNVMGPYNGSLKKAETLQLLDEVSNVLLTVPYTSVSPWPVASDGAGPSMVLANPSYGEGDPRAWKISEVNGGSPGVMESYQPNPLQNVSINELLAHSENPAVPQYVELYNHNAQSVDVSGCVLTDDAATNKFVIPSGTIIPPGGFTSFMAAQMGFALSPTGGTLYFMRGDDTRIWDCVQYPGQSDGVAWGRWPDGANDFYYLQTQTPGTNNSAIIIGSVAINELMYDPISGNDDDQYIELYNQSANSISLAGWQFTAGIIYSFPPTAMIAANGYVVVGRNVANLMSKYTNLTTANTFGDYSGKLSHNGERLALSMPQPLYGTNTVTVVEDEVTYGVGGRWGQWSGGGGSSLELIDPHANHRLAANWADSDETQKATWVDIENTGVLDNGANYESGILHAQIGLLDVGECLVDNVEVDFNGVNYIANPTFESGLGNWTLLGDHSRSSLDAGGYQSNDALHMRSTDRMWNGDNSCEANLNANSMAQGSTVTLRFKARWLHGWPEVLLRLNGGWLEATGPLQVPNNLGSPGMPNSKLVANAGPALYQVTHSPTIPAANQSVVVSTRVNDPDGIQTLVLHYRIDPSPNYVAVTMNDAGTGGDAMAKDGIFSATIAGQTSNTVVAFYLTATDSHGVQTRFPALLNNNAPVPECVVMFGDSVAPGAFTTYHSWITQTNIHRWANLSDLSNETCDFTFVNNTRVVYNVQGRFAGSPYHQQFDTPVGALCHYKWEFPDDDQFLGATDFNKIHQPGNYPGDDPSLQREQIANTFLRALGVPWLNRRYMAVFVNGNRRGQLMEDAQTPSSDIVKEHFPNDSDGFLFKMQPWFEFAPFPSGEAIGFNNESWCELLPFTTTGGGYKLARYRYMFEMRRTPDSANDYSDVFSMVQAANSSSSPNYVANMENVINMENWMRVFAANHSAGNWDSFGAQNGQNLYGYIGTQGTKYSLLMWDFNIVLGNSGSWGPGQNLFVLNGADSTMPTIFSTPEFLRMYWRALQELVNGPLSPSVSGPLAKAKYQAFENSGLSVENPTSAILPWLGQAQASIASQLAAVNASAFSVNPNIVVSNNVAYVSGGAPVNVDTVTINGAKWPLIWTSLTNWTVSIPLQAGLNQLSVAGLDRSSNPIAGDSGSAQATLNSTPPSPDGQVVINEIMYDPAATNGQFVEFYNNSTNTEFDLSGWEVPSLSYTFPEGATIAPNKYLVLAENGIAYDNAYGATNTFYDTFTGALPQTGQTLLSLQKPGVGGTNLVVAQVEYSDQLPWPTNAQGTGASLQLIDSHQDNWRAGNWTAAAPENNSPQWVHFSSTGTASSSLLYMYLQSAGDVYIDDVYMAAGSIAESGPNLLTDGGFESGFPGSVWTVSANLSESALSTTIKHSGNASLHLVATSGGTTQGSSIWQVMSPALVTNATYTLSFWYLQSTNGGPLTLRLSGSGTVATVNPAPTVPTLATPAAANSVATSLPEFPPLWINEVEPDNLSGITDSAGQHSPWIEIYNPTKNPVSLAGLFLSTNYDALTNWEFPSGAIVASQSFFVVFADGQTSLSTATEPHANFVLPPASGSIALSRIYNDAPQVLDYVDYANIFPNYSYGSFPDGQSFLRQIFFHPTPGGTNDGSSLPPPSFIPYLTVGDVYTQDFDTLPNPGETSVGAANPVTIDAITYSLANPFDFAYPASATGNDGGLGLPAMAGWYGLADSTSSVGTRFGATDGDDTTGGDLSFGLPGNGNRALGLLATSTTGYTAFGAKLINGTGETLNYINLKFTSEIWRQSNLAKTIEFYYLLDPTATNKFTTAASAYLPSLNINFPTVAGDTGGAAVDGTASANQIPLEVDNQYIGAWPPGGALWLVWEMASPAGKSQGMGIDDLSFSATITSALSPVTITAQTTSSTNLVLGWVGLPGETYQIEYSTNLSDPNWLPLNSPIPGTGAAVSVTNTPGYGPQEFYRLVILPASH